MTDLAVPICGKDVDQFTAQIKCAKAAGAQVLELRADYLTELNVKSLRKVIKSAKATDLPVIVTCRDQSQGGMNNWPLQLRIEILIEALKSGADFIDCEYENFLIDDVSRKISQGLSENSRARLILSAHNFNGKFPDLNKLYENILSVCSEAIPKLVYTPKHINDCFDAFDLLGRSHGNAIILCMGKAGLISRLLAKKLGALLTFASIDPEKATAPGQVTVEQMKSLYRWDSIDSDT